MLQSFVPPFYFFVCFYRNVNKLCVRDVFLRTHSNTDTRLTNTDTIAMADSDLQISGGGGGRGGHWDPEMRGRPGLKTIFFSALRASLDPLLLWHVPVVAGFTVQILHIPVTYCFIFSVGRSLTWRSPWRSSMSAEESRGWTWEDYRKNSFTWLLKLFLTRVNIPTFYCGSSVAPTTK